MFRFNMGESRQTRTWGTFLSWSNSFWKTTTQNTKCLDFLMKELFILEQKGLCFSRKSWIWPNLPMERKGLFQQAEISFKKKKKGEKEK